MNAVNSIEPRYGWGRAIKRTVLAIVVLIASVALLLWLNSILNDWSRFKVDRDGYMGIQIGASMDEAYYVFGSPQVVFGETENNWRPKGSNITVYFPDGSDLTHQMPGGKTLRDYDFWDVTKDNIHVGLHFDAKTKRLIGVRCSRAGPDDTAQCPWIYDIGPYENEQEIVSKLGPADKQSYAGPTKFLDWNRLGLEMRFQKQQPYIITKTNAGRPGFWWFLTHQVF